MNQAKRNVTLLAVAQALAMTVNTILITTAVLMGYALAEDKALATLPLAMRQVATMATTIPASMLMKQIGRQPGFVVGAMIGTLGGGLGIYAVWVNSFWAFGLAAVLLGVYNGFVGYYRFAAADAADVSFRAQAISWVVAGGVIAAVAGPWLAAQSESWFQSTFPSEGGAQSPLYIGSLAAILGLQLVTVFLLLWVDIPPLSDEERQDSGRSLAAVMKQPVFLVSLLGSMAGYGVMTLVMTATPLAMAAIPYPFEKTATVIQWHVLGMFAPSFVTGSLIKRFGVLKIILTGAVLNLVCLSVNLLGVSFPHFFIALFLLGIGWNFMFIGSTTLLTEAYAPAEKAKTQAAHDFLMFGFVALATLLSGQLYHSFSWDLVNQIGIPVILSALGAVFWLPKRLPSSVSIR